MSDVRWFYRSAIESADGSLPRYRPGRYGGEYPVTPDRWRKMVACSRAVQSGEIAGRILAAAIADDRRNP